MEAINIETTDKEVLIRLDKSDMSTEALVRIIKRLQVEFLAQKAGFTGSLLDIAEEIDTTWWRENGEDFLKNVKK
ncbi:MAG: hypothetical protein HC880_11960 [Bacteroidia bacterium]|nr:hypothetical protein [Bacteroidia bacterium]